MEARPRRRFTITDAMIIVAATGAVLATWPSFDFLTLYRNAFHMAYDLLLGNSNRIAVGRLGSSIPALLWPPIFLLSAATLTLMALRLVPP